MNKIRSTPTEKRLACKRVIRKIQVLHRWVWNLPPDLRQDMASARKKGYAMDGTEILTLGLGLEACWVIKSQNLDLTQQTWTPI
ncbi:hypothetical protein [Halomonas sp.]|uniref:hypothetical protein n=1 Tax=Halomonas sp. TaxID=1486246 RepID=UPI00384E50AC